MSSGDLFTLMRKANEAQAVRLGIPVPRQFSDDEIAESMDLLSQAERDLLVMSPAERLGQLSPVEQATLNDLNAKTLIPFRVSVTLPDRFEILNVRAPDACYALMQVIETLFGDFSTPRPRGFKIKVEPVKGCELRRVA